MSTRKHISLFADPIDPPLSRLLSVLSLVFGVDFNPLPTGSNCDNAPVLILADNDGTASDLFPAARAVFSAPAFSKTSAITGEVRFSNEPSVPMSFRSGVFECRSPEPTFPLQRKDLITLASLGSSPLWSVDHSDPSRPFFRSNIPIRGLFDREELIDALHEADFMGVLPLFVFLERFAGRKIWRRPGLFATAIIDDPNLHTSRYGYIDYRRLVEFSRETGFHACMATIPLDAWYVSARATEIFRHNTSALSLAYHGNDHELKEFSQPVTASVAAAIVAQARKRIRAFERRTRIPVAPIMIPPHGACSGVFLRALGAAGFAAATTTRTSIWRYNDSAERPLGSGIGPAEIVEGMPVIHRFRFSTERWRHRLAISAYLGHPIVIYGHHDDFRAGISQLSKVVAAINALGAQWLSPIRVLASNYLSSLTGSTLTVLPFSRMISLTTPPECTSLSLAVPQAPAWCTETVQLTFFDGTPPLACAFPQLASFPVLPNQQLTVTIGANSFIGSLPATNRRTRLKTIARRVITELRDRASGLTL